jgi:hypothetical protein
MGSMPMSSTEEKGCQATSIERGHTRGPHESCVLALVFYSRDSVHYFDAAGGCLHAEVGAAPQLTLMMNRRPLYPFHTAVPGKNRGK